MEIYESIAWIAMGFVPTLVTMEIAYRAASKFRLAVVSKMMEGVTTS